MKNGVVSKSEQSEPDGPRWYVVRSNFKQERLARSSLSAEGIVAYLPMLPKTNRKGELFATPLFPSFLFVQIGGERQDWHKVFCARGVSTVLGTGGRPQAIFTPGLEEIRRRELEAFRRMEMSAPACRGLTPGQTVRFKKGPWAELEAVFVDLVDSRRGLVLLSLLGGQRVAEAELAHIEAGAGA
ncbi:MAG TPA: transcription termination/antitermination NusG family protein [Bradyrhizobium sp.]|nr:transcription termination/antitermination NusG family protein [Bradyrhizobium sp.]